MPAVEAYSLGVPVEHGYITFSMGDPVRALYHDTSGDDLGWSFGYWFPSRCVGATPATATLPQAPTPVPTPAPTAGGWRIVTIAKHRGNSRGRHPASGTYAGAHSSPNSLRLGR